MSSGAWILIAILGLIILAAIVVPIFFIIKYAFIVLPATILGWVFGRRKKHK